MQARASVDGTGTVSKFGLSLTTVAVEVVMVMWRMLVMIAFMMEACRQSWKFALAIAAGVFEHEREATTTRRRRRIIRTIVTAMMLESLMIDVKCVIEYDGRGDAE